MRFNSENEVTCLFCWLVGILEQQVNGEKTRAIGRKEQLSQIVVADQSVRDAALCKVKF